MPKIYGYIVPIVLATIAAVTTAAKAGVTSQGSVTHVGLPNPKQGLIGVTIAPGQLSWTRGHRIIGGKERPGSLGIQWSDKLVEHPRFDSALMLEEADGRSMPLNAYRCSAGTCEKIEIVKKSDDKFLVRMDDAEFAIRYYARLCQEVDIKCKFFMPSWGLRQMGQPRQSAVARVPQMMVIHQQEKSLRLIDAEVGTTWVEWLADQDGLYRDLGLLRTAQIYENGWLIARFEYGEILFDLANDLILVGRKNGKVWMAQTGFGSDTAAKFSLLDGIPSTGFQHFGNQLVVHLAAIGTLDLDFNHTPQWSQQISVDGKWSDVQLVTFDETMSRLLAFDSDGSAGWYDLIETPKLSLKNYLRIEPEHFLGHRIMAGKYGLFRQEAQGGAWSRFDRKAMSWVEFHQPKDRMMDHLGDSHLFFLRRSLAVQESSSCDWVNLEMTDFGDKLTEAGHLAADCRSFFHHTSSLGGSVMAVAWQPTGEVLLKVWWP